MKKYSNWYTLANVVITVLVYLALRLYFGPVAFLFLAGSIYQLVYTYIESGLKKDK